MTYTLAAILGVLGAAVVDLAVLRTRLLVRKVFWIAYAIVLLFQLVVNGIIAGRHIVRYDPAVIVGPRVAHAPVEDLLFGFAMVLLTLSTWTWLGRRGVQP
ncbi:MAG: lycopene cyclase domain-containing protein [Gaiellaceae bacterium]